MSLHGLLFLLSVLITDTVSLKVMLGFLEMVGRARASDGPNELSEWFEVVRVLTEPKLVVDLPWHLSLRNLMLGLLKEL